MWPEFVRILAGRARNAPRPTSDESGPGPMRIAYLVNTFPMTSTTFVRREMDALEAAGVEIYRYAVRRWSEPLIDPLDHRDQARTHYLLSGNGAGLAWAFVRQIVTGPLALARGIGLGVRLSRNARGRIFTHLAYLMEAVYFRQQAKAAGIDHVHAHFSTNAAALALLSQRMGGPSYSFTAHGPDEFLTAERDSLSIKMRHAAFVVAISEFCRAALVRLGGGAYGGKIVVARCGLLLSEFPPASRESEASANRSRDIVCVGRLCPQKGQAQIPAAITTLRHEFPDLRIILVGDGESRAEIEAQIEEHRVESMIDLRGWRCSDEVRAVVASSRALLLPSFAEGLPIVIIEALALGRPVITTTVAGIPELVDSACGWIIRPGDVRALADAIGEAMRADPALLSEMGHAGRARVEQFHDVADLARILRGLFANAIAVREREAVISIVETHSMRTGISDRI